MKLFHKDYIIIDEDDKPVVSNRHRDFTGSQFGKWKVTERLSGTYYMVECACGKIAKKAISSLLALATKQCKSCYRASKEAYWFKR